MKVWQKEMTAFQEAIEAYPERKEPTPVEMENIAAYPEVPNEEATVETIRALYNWYGDQDLAVGSCRQPTKWTQGHGVSWQKFTTAHRRLTCHAIPAPHKGHSCQEPGKNSVVCRTPKGPTIQMRCLTQPKCDEQHKGLRSETAVTTGKQGKC
jgi:hypothetical protein